MMQWVETGAKLNQREFEHYVNEEKAIFGDRISKQFLYDYNYNIVVCNLCCE